MSLTTQDAWTVEYDRKKREHEIGPEQTRTEASGRYSSEGYARAWAHELMERSDVLAVRIYRHQWNAELVHQESKA